MFTGLEMVNCSEVLKLSYFVNDQFRLLFESNEVQRKSGIYFSQLITVALEISWSVFQYLLRFNFLETQLPLGKI